MFAFGGSKTSNFYFIFIGGIIFGISLTLLTHRVNVRSMVFRQECRLYEMGSTAFIRREEESTLKSKEPRENATTKSSEAAVLIDSEKHRGDNSSTANRLSEKVRILCWVMTSPQTIHTKGKTVLETWGKRCTKLLFASDYKQDGFPTMDINVSPGRGHLVQKTMHAFDYVYKHHNEYDWIFKADDDTYAIMENMRYMLADFSPKDKIAFGHHFKPYVKQGYFSGGAGYVISKAALEAVGRRKPKQCKEDGAEEDLYFGQCLENVGTKPMDSRDNLGRSRFHCIHAKGFISGNVPDWYYQYSKYGKKGEGASGMSDYSISFHYVTPAEMWNFEFYVYHLRPYGILNSQQNLNRKNR